MSDLAADFIEKTRVELTQRFQDDEIVFERRLRPHGGNYVFQGDVDEVLVSVRWQQMDGLRREVQYTFDVEDIQDSTEQQKIDMIALCIDVIKEPRGTLI